MGPVTGSKEAHVLNGGAYEHQSNLAEAEIIVVPVNPVTAG